jgi:ubiquinone/menaquinone biosynthesis C-methylase UbiE
MAHNPEHGEPSRPGAPVLDPAIQRYYGLGQEQNRLLAPGADIERLRTQDILNRYLPAPPAVICDVGGAAGIHAFPLAERGYRVHLIDPVALHLQQAQAHSAKSGIALESIVPGDARALGMPAGGADAMLLLGPLYHLIEQADRQAALKEAHRILKPGGVLIAAAISRYASLMDGLATGFFADEQFRELVRRDLSSGQHRNPTDSTDYFTTAYFHRAEELRAEVQDVDFGDIKILGIEGPAWGAAAFRPALADAAQREALLQMLSEIEEEPSIVGASAHLIAVARKR